MRPTKAETASVAIGNVVLLAAGIVLTIKAPKGLVQRTGWVFTALGTTMLTDMLLLVTRRRPR